MFEQLSISRYVLVSIICGALFSFLTIAVAVKMVGPEISELPRFVFWNLNMAVNLVRDGWLPICVKCELASFLTVLIYAFIIGVLGYSPVLFAMFYLRKVSRPKL